MRRIIVPLMILLLLASGAAMAAFDPDWPPLPPESIPEYDRISYELLSMERAKLAIYCGDLTQLSRPFTLLELACLSPEELRLLCNTIFAAHGLIFKSEQFSKHFSFFPWYKPERKDASELLTEVDKRNIQAIQAFEKAPDRKMDETALRKVLIGGWHALPITPSGYNDRMLLKADGEAVYYFNQMDGTKRVWKMEGRWRLEKGYVILEIKTKYVNLGGYYTEPYGSYGSDFILEHSYTGVLQLDKPQIFRLPVLEYLPTAEAGLPRVRLGSNSFWRMWDVSVFEE